MAGQRAVVCAANQPSKAERLDPIAGTAQGSGAARWS